MSIQMPNPDNPIGGKPDFSPPSFPGRIIIITVIGLIAGFFIGKYTSTGNKCESTTLWDGKYVKAIVVNQASERGVTGLMQVNIVNDFDQDRYLCLYKFDASMNRALGDTLYIKAHSQDQIPIATEIKKSLPLEVEMYSDTAFTSINEHSSHDHGSLQNIHRKSHYGKGGTDDTYEIELDRASGASITIDATHPLYTKADDIYTDLTTQGPRLLNVFILVVGDNLVEIDTCHYHNGISQGCLNN